MIFSRHGWISKASSYILGTKPIDSQRDVDRWPTLETEEASEDMDRDGIPDGWEHELDSHEPSDREDEDHDGYTNLEEFNGTDPSQSVS